MNPTRVRYAVLGVATANAFILYLDRICMGAVVQSASFQQELGLGKDRIGDVLAAFFSPTPWDKCRPVIWPIALGRDAC